MDQTRSKITICQTHKEVKRTIGLSPRVGSLDTVKCAAETCVRIRNNCRVLSVCDHTQQEEFPKTWVRANCSLPLCVVAFSGHKDLGARIQETPSPTLFSHACVFATTTALDGKSEHDSKRRETKSAAGRVFHIPTWEVEEINDEKLKFGYVGNRRREQKLITDEVVPNASTSCRSTSATPRRHHGECSVRGLVQITDRGTSTPSSVHSGWMLALASSPVESWMLKSPQGSASNQHLAIPTSWSTPPVGCTVLDRERVVDHGLNRVPEPKLPRQWFLRPRSCQPATGKFVLAHRRHSGTWS